MDGGLGSHQVTCCATAGCSYRTVKFRNKKNKGFYSLIHGTMIKILYCFVHSIYYLKAALIHSRDNPHSGRDGLLHGNLSAATPKADRPSREMLHQSPNIHRLENQFYKNARANNDKILCVRYILYIKIIQKSL